VFAKNQEAGRARHCQTLRGRVSGLTLHNLRKMNYAISAANDSV
jgi:hypothetical protein